MKYKECSKCKEVKPVIEFCKSSRNKSGLYSKCKSCQKEYRNVNKEEIKIKNKERYNKNKGEILRKTKEYKLKKKSCPKAFLNQLYNSMYHRRKVDFSKKLFIEFYLINKVFLELFDCYVNSGFNKMLAPSIDRIDDYRHYTWANTRMVTWKENFTKGTKDRREGRNNKTNKAVIRIDFFGNRVKYHSCKDAARKNNLNDSHISSVARGERKTHGNYYWEYER